MPDRGPGTGTNYEKRVNRTRNSVRENGPSFLDFPLFLGIFQWEEPTKRVPFTTEPEIPEILTKWKASQVTLQYPMSPNARAKIVGIMNKSIRCITEPTATFRTRCSFLARVTQA